jgi:hypothetical protein
MRTSRHALLTRSLLALCALLAATVVYAQAQNAGRNLNIFAVNLDNKEVYSVTFTPPGGSTTIGNTDESNYVRPEALAFVTNAKTNQLDLLIGDNQRGTIYRYPGALAPQTPPNPTTATLVWNSQTAGTGPPAPDALAVDGYGNLFVANSTSGHSQSTQLWMFPVGAAGSGSFANPVLLDSNFQNKETLLEVALAPSDVAGATGVSGGDLVVLTTSRVLAYSRSSGYISRITLLSFPNGSPVPGGMDFWPLGNGATANYSLLVSSSSTGVINRYYFTNPLTAAPAPFATGLGTLYKMKTLFQQGHPLVFVSQSGSILEFGANANGTGALLATVTQSVTVPQGLAVSNSFTNAASVCLQPGGCNLTGLLNHTLTGVSSLTGDIVENVCTVNADPRVSVVGGVWSCSVPYIPPAGFSCPAGTPANGPGCLPINAMCPGFDDTGKMAIPDTMCGRSGSSGAGFSLVKTLAIPNQFLGGYVQDSAVLADGSDPLCGPGAGADGAFLWAPLQAEGTVIESPNMVDITNGCGTIHGGKNGLSVTAVGLSVNEAAPELTSGGLPRPLENFTQAKYTDLAATINNLTQVDPNHARWTDGYPNVAASISLELWGGNVPPVNNVDAFGCLDLSWLDFYYATQLDTDGSLQWTADLQNAANVLTNADATGNTTCDGIVTYAEATNPTTAFVQTPNATYPNAPTELNPYGQLRSRTSNLYYTINTRILGNPASAIWPLPVSVNVLPTSVTLASSTSSGSATLSWNTNGASGCMLSSSDNTYQNAPLSSPQQLLNIPSADAGSIVTYTVSCTGPAASTVFAYVTVYPPPSISVSPGSIEQGSAATLSWNTNHAQGCTASTTDTTPADAFSGAKTGTGSMALAPALAGSFSYSLSCTSPATTVSANLIVVAPPTMSISAPSIVQGSGATITWNANGNTGCSWSSTDPTFTAPTGASGSTVVNPTTAGSFSYTYACTAPVATTQSVTVSVVQQPTLTLSPSTVIQGSGAMLSWNYNGNSGCTWMSSDPGFTTPTGSSGSTTVKPASAGSFSYTLTCPAPTQPVTVTLTVNAPQPPAISVSPSSITLGNSSTLAWTINTGDVCTGSSSGTDTNAADAFTGMVGVSGSKSVTPNHTGTDTYTLTCTVPATSKSATLTVNPSLAKIAISVALSGDGDLDDPATLSWSLSGGATGCVVSGAWPKYAVPQFSPFAVSASGSNKLRFTAAGTYIYTISCTNPSTPASTSVTVRPDDHD